MAEKKQSPKPSNVNRTTSVEQRMELIAAQLESTSSGDSPALSEHAVRLHLKNQAATIQAIKEDHAGDRDVQKTTQRNGLLSLGIIIAFLVVLIIVIAFAKPDLLDKLLGYIFSFIGGAGLGGAGVAVFKDNKK